MDEHQIIPVAASQSDANQLEGRSISRCPTGYLKRIKAVGFVAYGTDVATGAAEAFDGDYLWRMQADNITIVQSSRPTGFIARAGTEAGSGEVTGLMRGTLLPMNTYIAGSGLLTCHCTTPANGECLLIMETENIPAQ